MIDYCNVRLLQGCCGFWNRWLSLRDRCVGFPHGVFSAYCCLHGSRGCIGCHSTLVRTSSPNELVKSKRSLATISSKTRLSDTSNCDVDTGRVQSQGRFLPLSTLIKMSDSQGAGSSDNPSEFVNHGLILWNQTRQQWVESRKPKKQTGQREPRISWRATYDSLLGNNKPFRKPIPLSEMIDFLVDVWEQEGMYD